MERISWRNFDFWLMGTVIVLVIIGVAMINSAVANNTELVELNVSQRQLIFAAAGFTGAMILAFIDYRTWASMSSLIYAVSFGLLGVLYIIGAAFFGAARWFQTGLFDILLQPSEIAKIAVILVLANFFARNQDKIHGLGWVVNSFLLTFGLVIWILLQPNLSTSIVVMVIWFSMLWVSGIRLKFLAIAGITGTVILAILIVVGLPYLINPDLLGQDGLIKPYQVDRVRNFLFPDPEASYGETYNVNQAKITIGSGGWFGKGYGQGTQTQLRFLKVRHIDFIFSVIGEELGFAGASLIIFLQAFLVIRCLRAARLARDTYGALIAYGVATTIAFQGMVNMGVNLNLLPVTGLTLPFVSYGGSSLVSLFVGIGLVQSVALRRRTPE